MLKIRAILYNLTTTDRMEAGVSYNSPKRAEKLSDWQTITLSKISDFYVLQLSLVSKNVFLKIQLESVLTCKQILLVFIIILTNGIHQQVKKKKVPYFGKT